MDSRYKSCTLTDLAQMIDLDVNTFQDWLTPDDLTEMIRLGWNPFARKMKPAVVLYLRDKYIDPELKRTETSNVSRT